MSKRKNEAEVLLNRLMELHGGWIAHGCERRDIMKLTAAMMAVLTQRAFPQNPTQNDLMEFPTRLLNCNMVWERFVSLHPESLIYSPDMFRKWIWALYRGHADTRAGLWKVLGWETFNTDDEEVGNGEEEGK